VQKTQSRLKVPEFIVVKASPSESLHEDRVLILVEVKPQEMSRVAAEEQLSAYLEGMVLKNVFGGELLVDRLCGVLVSGNRVQFAELQAKEYSDMFDIEGQAVHDFLRDIAAYYGG
jgi:hypothetical protein